VTEVSVLIPYREDSTQRAKLLDHCLKWWRQHMPSDWEVVIGSCDTEDWCKAQAYDDALRGACGRYLVFADADVMLPGTPVAVVALRDGWAWARSHDLVVRLNSTTTEQLLATSTAVPWSAQVYTQSWEHWEDWPYEQKAAGAGVCVQRDVYENVPHDPRFLGWGCEDEAWGYALQTMYGPEAKVRGMPCIHLWHPSQPKPLRRGSVENQVLLARYSQARHSVEPQLEMAALLAEATMRLSTLRSC
jgi:hypothetical protein